MKISQMSKCFLYKTITLVRLWTFFECFFNRQLDLLNMPFTRPASNWSLESGYNDPDNLDIYPFHVFGTGKKASFTVLLRMFTHDIDRLCTGAVQGFQITFHPPHEGPQVLKRYFQVSPGKTALFSIIPRLIITADNVRKYSPDVRLCYFSTERHLRFYKKYSQRNCEVECLANYTLSQCGCVRFSMPSM